MATVGWSRIVTASSDGARERGLGGRGAHTFVLLAWVLQGSGLLPASAPSLLLVLVLLSL